MRRSTRSGPISAPIEQVEPSAKLGAGFAKAIEPEQIAHTYLLTRSSRQKRYECKENIDTFGRQSLAKRAAGGMPPLERFGPLPFEES